MTNFLNKIKRSEYNWKKNISFGAIAEEEDLEQRKKYLKNNGFWVSGICDVRKLIFGAALKSCVMIDC